MSKDCVRCGCETTTEKVFCVEVKDYHCTHKACGYKELRVIEHPPYAKEDVDVLIEYLHAMGDFTCRCNKLECLECKTVTILARLKGERDD